MSVGAVNKQTGDRIPTAGMPAIDSVLSGSSTNPVQNRVVKAALDEKADTDIVASDFDATASYTAGNYCIYQGKFYRFKANHSGAWSAADVDEIKIAGELSSLMSGLISAAKAVYRDYHQIATSGNYTFTPTLEMNHAYIVAICSGNNDVWGYCGIMLKGWEGTAPVLTDIYKGIHITVAMVDTDSIQVSNADTQYNADSEIVVIDLGRGIRTS